MIVELGLYRTQITRILNFFPKEQLLIIKIEDLNKAHVLTIENTLKWLGVSNIELSKKIIIHNSKNDISIFQIQRWGNKIPIFKRIILSILGYPMTNKIASIISNFY